MISFIIFSFFSPIAAIFIFISYILGFIVSWLLIKYQSKTNIYIQQLTSFYRDCLLTRKKVSSSCSICDDLSCKRHEKSQSIAPWKHLYITSKLNFAVEHVRYPLITIKLMSLTHKCFLVLWKNYWKFYFFMVQTIYKWWWFFKWTEILFEIFQCSIH